ncbi:hypothetical protein GCM10010232_53230 [Streptomyces amakusaensis]|uniref:Secreted protein n=1 Tax=Streptomyces amakusaensis TaxID=67271 RepID=A0ABW0AL41_9ACTN
MTVPRQSASPDETFRPPEGRRRMIVRRWLTAIIIVLLVGIPAGYLVISAEQSRESGRHKAAESSASGLRDNWPSQMKRRVFEIPIPMKSTDVAYFETSNWQTSRLYVQFTTTAAGLDRFLADVGTGRDELTEGEIAISRRHAETVGWDFGGDFSWASVSQNNPHPRPSQDITVDRTDPDRPRVFVVSAANP